MRNDWMPSTRATQLAMAKRWIELLPDKEEAWRMPEGMVERLAEYMSAAAAWRGF